MSKSSSKAKILISKVFAQNKNCANSLEMSNYHGTLIGLVDFE